MNGRAFEAGEMIDTDGKSFTECTFDSAVLVYSGGEHPFFERCTFNGSTSWRFRGPALRTVQFLQRIASDAGGENFIASLFEKGRYFGDDPG